MLRTMRTFAVLFLLVGADAAFAANVLPEKAGEVFSAPAFGKHGYLTANGQIRTFWDFDRAMDLSHGDRVTFEFRCSDDSVVNTYTCYLRTGSAKDPSGWYVIDFAPSRPGWNCAVFAQSPLGLKHGVRLSGKPSGWDKITGMRISLWGEEEIADKNGPTTQFEMRDFRILKQGETAPISERRLTWMCPEGVNKDWDWPRTAKFLADCRMTDAIVRTTEKGRLCYRSAYSPSDEKLLAEHGDQLAQGIEACHRAGLRFHGWIICWQVRGTRAHVDEMRRAGRMQEPDQTGKGGTPWPWLCPNDPRNVTLEADLACELAARGADGVHLDYIRYCGDHGCFCARCRGLFEKRLGRPVANWPQDVKAGGCETEAWDAFRRDTITQTVRTIRERLKAANPKVELSVAVQPRGVMKRCAQDWPRWCEEKLVDFVCPMDYRLSPQSFAQLLRHQKPISEATGVPFYPGIGITASARQLTAWQVGRQIDIARQMCFPGYTFFWLLKGNAHIYRQLADEGPLSE